MTELATRNDGYTGAPLDQRMTYARTLASASDLIPTGLHDKGMKQLENGVWVADGTSTPNPGKVLLVMETGAMLGIHPVAALQGVHIIEGKATISPALMSAVVRRAGHQLRVETRGSVADQTFEATATLVRKDDPDHPFIATWNRERAQRADLLSKKPWQRYFEAMCKARAISEVCREGATDALMGVGYVPEELGADVTEEGEIIATPVRPSKTTAQPPTTQQSQPTPNASEPSAQPPQQRNQEKPITQQRKAGERDWRAEADATQSADRVLAIFNECRDAGQLGQTTEVNGEQVQLRVYLRKRGETLRAAEVAKQQPDEGEVVEGEIVDDGPAGVLDDSIDVDPQTGVVRERDEHTTGGHY